MVKTHNIFIVILFTLLFCMDQSNAQSNFVRISLPNGVTIDLPRNWSVMSDNRRITLDTWRESVLEAHKLSDEKSDYPFAANYYDDNGNTAGTFGIRFYPNIEVTELETIAGGATFIKHIDESVKENYKKGLEAGGGKLVVWLGTATKSINGSMYFISKNRTLSPKGDGFRGTLVRYLNAGKSFTIIISYREDQELYLSPICDKIINSIRH